ncbi:RloB family protein [Cetobacterium sp.]|uniref:RloB family protein n=1 Tax=Cetobacterium sp. TaxID=2071632 RepID=UPI003F2CA3F0
MGRVRASKVKEEREPKKVFLLACEGRHTERKYFSGLSDEYKNKNLINFVKVNIFEKSDQDLSNPKKILDELNEKKEKDGFLEDEIYLVVDRDADSFTEEQLKSVKDGCIENGYQLILSNPNFELWLLFHFIENFSNDDKDDIKADKTIIEIKLQQFLKESENSRAESFNKKILFKHYKERVQHAIKIAKENEYDLKKLKDTIGTNVFKLVEKIIEV